MFVNDLFENNKITEGSVQDKLHRRHQELRKKSGLPDPDYYKELKASYDIEDGTKRIARQAEIKKKYRVSEGNLQEFAPGDGNNGRWYSDDDLADIVGEDWYEFDLSHEMGNIGTQGERARIFLAQQAEAYLNDRGYNVNVLDVRDQGDNLSWYISGSLMNEQGVAEGDTLDTGPDGKLTTKGEEQMRRYRQQKREQERQQIIAKHTKTVKGDTYGVAPSRISQSRNEVNWAAANKELRKKGLDEQGVAEGVERYLEEMRRAGYDIVTEAATLCPECGGPAYNNQMLAEKQDACYHKVKSRYKVWPSAYASGALVRCRKKGAKNWGNKSKK
jgi:hypothetical protein